ncbi:MAG TPA: hypothetical protein VMS17_16695, partial [Gemmataceae bacterium]|nr:hypothetical protein [Gemmataceae bacterium]
MANIGNLSVTLGLDGAQFQQGLQDAERSARKNLASIRGQIDTFGMSSKSAEAFRLRQQGVSEATIAATAAANQQLDTMRRQQGMAERLGAAVARLTGSGAAGDVVTAVGNRLAARSAARVAAAAAPAPVHAAPVAAAGVASGAATAAARIAGNAAASNVATAASGPAAAAAPGLGRAAATGAAAGVGRAAVMGAGATLAGRAPVAAAPPTIPPAAAPAVITAAPAFGGLAAAAGGVVTAIGATTLAVGGAVIGFGLLAASGVRNIATQAKLAQRFQISTEAVAGLQLAAGRAGLDMDALGGTLQMVQRQIGRAATGAGPAHAMFQTLGLDAQQLANTPLDEALGRIVDRINALPRAADRAAAGFMVFRNQWADVQKLGGSAGLEAARQRSQQLGLTVSRPDAAAVLSSQRAMRGAGADAGSVFQSVANSAAISVAPAITAVSGFVSDLVLKLQPVIQIVRDVVGWVGRTISGLVDGVGAVFSAMAPAFQAVIGTAGALWDVVKGIFGTGQGLGETLKGVGQVVGSVLAPVFQAVATILDGITAGVGDIADAVGSAFGALKAAALGVWDTLQGVLGTGEGLGETFRAVAGFVGTAFKGVLGVVADAVRGIAGAVGPVFEQIGAAVSSVAATLAPVFEPILDALSSVWDALKGIFGDVSGLGGVFKVIGTIIGTVVQSALFGVALVIRGIVEVVSAVLGPAFAVVGAVVRGIADVVEWMVGLIRSALNWVRGNGFQSGRPASAPTPAAAAAATPAAPAAHATPAITPAEFAPLGALQLFGKLQERLTEQAQTLGLATDAVARFKLAQEGATSQMLKTIHDLQMAVALGTIREATRNQVRDTGEGTAATLQAARNPIAEGMLHFEQQARERLRGVEDQGPTADAIRSLIQLSQRTVTSGRVQGEGDDAFTARMERERAFQARLQARLQPLNQAAQVQAAAQLGPERAQTAAALQGQQFAQLFLQLRSPLEMFRDNVERINQTLPRMTPEMGAAAGAAAQAGMQAA